MADTKTAQDNDSKPRSRVVPTPANQSGTALPQAPGVHGQVKDTVVTPRPAGIGQYTPGHEEADQQKEIFRNNVTASMQRATGELGDQAAIKFDVRINSRNTPTENDIASSVKNNLADRLGTVEAAQEVPAVSDTVILPSAGGGVDYTGPKPPEG